MNTQQKKKLCWNCEGNVSRQEENCPYCGVYLSPNSATDDEDEENNFSPPYSINTNPEAQAVPSAPYSANERVIAQKEPKAQLSSPSPMSQSKGIVSSILLLIGGSIFFLFGIVLLLFSHDEILTLQWDGSYWFAYFLISLPMLFFGWKFLLNLESDN